MLKRSIKEHKHVAAQMEPYDPLLEEAVYTFQDPRIVAVMSKAMSKGAYLRPHLDNSHDKNRKRYWVVNLLYYVTPDWREHLSMLRKCGFRLGVPGPPHRRFAAAEDLGCRNSTA